MNSSLITVLFQGNVNSYSAGEIDSFVQNVNRTRFILPNSEFILSTWENIELPKYANIDRVVYSRDPGSLPGIKLDDSKPNNINRQIVTTANGLTAVKTPYVLKLRTDCFLDHAGFIEYYEEFKKLINSRNESYSPILASCFFTIDPKVYEHMPFHISDWVQFGETMTVQKYWDVPLMNYYDATYYEKNTHRILSGYFDKKFRTRLAVEQHVATNYANNLGYEVPKFHNDVSSHVLRDHYRFLAEQIIILDPWQMGLDFPKYHWAYNSRFASMNCTMYVDWYANFVKHWTLEKAKIDNGLLELALSRSKSKLITRLAATAISPVGEYWYSPRNKRLSAQLSKRFRDIIS